MQDEQFSLRPIRRVVITIGNQAIKISTGKTIDHAEELSVICIDLHDDFTLELEFYQRNRTIETISDVGHSSNRPYTPMK